MGKDGLENACWDPYIWAFETGKKSASSWKVSGYYDYKDQRQIAQISVSASLFSETLIKLPNLLVRPQFPDPWGNDDSAWLIM